MASIKSSLDLEKTQDSDDLKQFLFVVENVALCTESEEL